MKKFICMLLVLSMAFALCACDGDTNDDNDKTINSISKLLNIVMTEKCLIESNESENGFVTVKIEDEKTDSEIKTEWNELPLTENLTALIYGIESDTSSVGPYIKKMMSPYFLKSKTVITILLISIEKAPIVKMIQKSLTAIRSISSLLFTIQIQTGCTIASLTHNQYGDFLWKRSYINRRKRE